MVYEYTIRYITIIFKIEELIYAKHYNGGLMVAGDYLHFDSIVKLAHTGIHSSQIIQRP